MFDYFYGAQADQFAFYRIPKNLFTDPRFAALSSDAKVLYGLMLDRMGLSARNGWKDEQGRVYIVFSVDEVCEAMGVRSNKTAIKYMAELDTTKGIGLIERVRLGQGKKDRIYVLNFITGSEAPVQQGFPVVSTSEEDKPAEKKKEQVSPASPAISGESSIYTSRSVKSTLLKTTPESGEIQKCKNYTSGNVESTLLEVQKVHANNNTDFSNNNINNTMHSISPFSQSNYMGPPMSKYKSQINAAIQPQGYGEIRSCMEEKIEADTLKEEYGEEIIDEIVELITGVMETQAPSIRIAGEDRPIEVVRGLFGKITAAHVEAALWDLRKHSTPKIVNMPAYMQTLLFNSLRKMNTEIYHAARF
jgi:hypothetical protein